VLVYVIFRRRMAFWTATQSGTIESPP